MEMLTTITWEKVSENGFIDINEERGCCKKNKDVPKEVISAKTSEEI